MWSWKPAKRALEHLFAAGELAIAGRNGFQRVYDLPERVIPREFLDAPTPSEDEFRRGYALRAVQGRGALTERGIAEHCRFRGGAAAMRPIVDGLVEEGLVRRVAVEDGGPPVVVAAGVQVDGRASRGGVLVSPFDSLLWDKPFVERVFGFQPLIEVYKREHERIYGYYVLPFLLGDRFAGRADLKADRGEGVLRVKAFHVEPGVRAVEAARRGIRSRAGAAGAKPRPRAGGAMRLVSPEEARRIAVRAQLLDGSATSVLDTVRRLGFLQLDPISTVAPPQHLVLWSRLGSAYDQAELDRLLWEEKKLFEYVAFIRPIEDLPLIRARMRRRRGTSTPTNAAATSS